MGSEKTRILIADDDPRYVRAIRLNLEASGYEVATASDGPSAVQSALCGGVDLLLLDLVLPGQNGYEVCRQVREQTRLPIIILSARAADADKVRALDLGADDYVTKPFSVEELLARVRAALRRGELLSAPSTPPVFRSGELRVDLLQQRVFVREREINLTPIEFRLLRELIQQPGQVLVPEVLLERVWGNGSQAETGLLWQAIHRLRVKLEPDEKQSHYILTRPGAGYLFVASG